MLCNSYYWVIEGTCVQPVADIYLRFFVSGRNCIFMGFFFVLLGVVCARVRITYAVIATGVFYVFYLIELCFLHGRHMRDDGALFLLVPLVAMGLVKVASEKFSGSNHTVLFRNLSTGIYLLHSPIIRCFVLAEILFGFSFSCENLFIGTLCLAISLCLTAYKMRWKIAALLK